MAATRLAASAHVLFVGAHHDDIVGIVGDGRCHCAGAQAIALQKTGADVAGVFMALHHGNLQYVVLHVDAVRVAGVHRGDLAGHHADDAPGTGIGEVRGGERAHVEGGVGPIIQILLDLRCGKVLQHAVVHHPLASLINLLDVKVFKIVNDHEIRQIARRDGAAVIEQEVAGGVVAGHLYGGDGSAPRAMASLTI